jgi:hypothetical protein
MLSPNRQRLAGRPRILNVFYIKMKVQTPVFKKLIGVFAIVALISACSSHADNTSAPKMTQADILVQTGQWHTTGATLMAANGTSLTLAGNDPFLKTILLYNVTFYSNGTATDTNDPNGLTANGLTWTLSGSHLLVHINDNNTDKVDGIVTYLSDYKLILKVTDFYQYNGVTYTSLIQTFTH